jgi:hypothetical protein
MRRALDDATSEVELVRNRAKQAVADCKAENLRLRDAFSRAEAETQRERTAFVAFKNASKSLAQENATLRAKVAALEGALRKLYFSHSAFCPYRLGRGECDCGAHTQEAIVRDALAPTAGEEEPHA